MKKPSLPLPRALPAFLLAICLSACAFPPRGQFVPLPDQAKELDNPAFSRIYVVRPYRFWGGGVGIPVADGDKAIGSLSAGGFLSWEREPGTMKVRSMATRRQELTVDVRAGERVYLMQDVKASEAPLTLLDTERGKAMLAASEPPQPAPEPANLSKTFNEPTIFEREDRFFGKGYVFPYYALYLRGGSGVGVRYSRELKSWVSADVDLSYIKGVEYEVNYTGGAWEGVKGTMKTDLSPLAQVSLFFHPPSVPYFGLGIGLEHYSYDSRFRINSNGFNLTAEKKGTHTNDFYPILGGGLMLVNKTRPYKIVAAVNLQVRGNNDEKFILRPVSGFGQTYTSDLSPIRGTIRFSFGIQYGLGPKGAKGAHQ